MNRSSNRKPNLLIVLALAGAIDALLLGSLWTMEVTGVNRLTFNLTELKARNKGSELVQKGRRAEIEKQRNKAKLKKEDAGKLREQAEERKKKELKKRLSDMHRIDDQIETVKKQRLDAVANRSLADLNAAAAEKLRAAFFKIQTIADAVRATGLDHSSVRACTFGIKTFRKDMDFFLEKPTGDARDLLLKSADRFLKESAGPTGEQSAANPKLKSISSILVPMYGRVRDFKAVLNLEFQLDDAVLSKFNKIELPPPIQLSDEDFERLSLTEISNQIADLEKNIVAAHEAIRAAELALREGKPFKTAYETVKASGSEEEIETILLPTEDPSTVGELNEYRKKLEALVQSANARYRRSATLAQQSGVRIGAPGANTGKTFVIGGGAGGSGGYGGDDLSKQWEDVVTFASRYKPGGDRQYEVIPSERDKMGRNARPARRFTRNSKRGGWLFIDTWYVIGPWENGGRIDFAKMLQPDLSVDLDAVYPDGQVDKATGKPRTLKWQFTQSDGPKVIPPNEEQRATYFAYTEVFFEEETEMMLAIGSDDSARGWVNGVKIWEDMGYTPWRFDEGLVKVRFKKGLNTIKIRFENGGGFCNFSVLLCPTSMVSRRENR